MDNSKKIGYIRTLKSKKNILISIALKKKYRNQGIGAKSLAIFERKTKLKNLTVVKGDIISAGDIIADLVTNSDGITELQFQVWKNNIKLNPENWIIKK